MQLGFDAQRVIALRMTRLAAGGAAGQNESYRMVAEKIAAVREAQTVAAIAIAAGQKIRLSPKKTGWRFQETSHYATRVSLFDHLVGPPRNRFRDGQTQGLAALKATPTWLTRRLAEGGSAFLLRRTNGNDQAAALNVWTTRSTCAPQRSSASFRSARNSCR
jgi:hypothetical protein